MTSDCLGSLLFVDLLFLRACVLYRRLDVYVQTVYDISDEEKNSFFVCFGLEIVRRKKGASFESPKRV